MRPGRDFSLKRHNLTVSRRDFLKGALALGATALIAAGSQTTRAASLRAEPAKVTFWHTFGGALLPEIETLVRTFNEAQSDVVVTPALPATSYNGLVTALSAAYEVGKSPDLIQTAFPIALARNGYLEPLDSLAAGAGVSLPDFAPVLMADAVHQGATYALPNARSVPVIYTNQTVMGASGLAGDTLLSTWSSLLQHGPSLRKPASADAAGTVPMTAYGCPPFFWFWTQMTWAFGGEIASPDGAVLFNQGPAVEALQFWQDMVHRDQVADTYPNGTGFASWGAASAAWHNQQIATVALSTAQFPQTFAQIPRVAPSGATNAPAASMTPATPGQPPLTFVGALAAMPGERVQAVPVGGASLALSARSQQKEAAFQFMAWLTASEQERVWHEATGYLPGRASTLSLPAVQQLHAAKPDFAVAPRQLAVARRLPVIAEATEIEPVINRMLEKVVLSGEDVQASVDAAATEVAQLWQRYLAQRPA